MHTRFDRDVNPAKFQTEALPYIRTDGAVVAADFAALFSTLIGTDHDLINRVNQDESGTKIGDDDLWTGSSARGTDQGTEHCSLSGNAWTTDSNAENGTFGQTFYRDEKWINSGPQTCSTTARLYCVLL